MSPLYMLLMIILGAAFGDGLRRAVAWLLTKRAERKVAALRSREQDEYGPEVRTPSYLEDTVQGTHAGQRAVDEDSNDDSRSRLIDAIAAAYRKKLEAQYPPPPEPPSVASPRERGEWLQACSALHHRVNVELCEFINACSGSFADELDRIASELHVEGKK